MVGSSCSRSSSKCKKSCLVYKVLPTKSMKYQRQIKKKTTTKNIKIRKNLHRKTQKLTDTAKT